MEVDVDAKKFRHMHLLIQPSFLKNNQAEIQERKRKRDELLESQKLDMAKKVKAAKLLNLDVEKSEAVLSKISLVTTEILDYIVQLLSERSVGLKKIRFEKKKPKMLNIFSKNRQHCFKSIDVISVC